MKEKSRAMSCMAKENIPIPTVSLLLPDSISTWALIVGLNHFFPGDYYEGTFVDGIKQGDGKLVFTSTQSHETIVYEGKFDKNEINGKGMVMLR